MGPEMSKTLSENECTKLFEDMQAELSWEWDSRFETALAQIAVKEKNIIGKILENYLGTAWDSTSIYSAPDRVQRIIARLGGIMKGQLFYAAALSQDGSVFCAWWPWGNGQTISIRFGTSQEGSALLATLASPDAS